MNFSKQITFLFLFFIPIVLLSQRVDLQYVNECLIKADSLKKIDKSQAFNELSKALKTAETLENNGLKAKIYLKKAKIFDFYSEWDSSFVYYQKAAPLFEQIHDSVSAAKCYNNIGVTYYFYGDHNQALINYQKSSKLLENSDEYILHAKILNNIALINKSKGDYRNAINNFHKCIDLNEKAGNDAGMANNYQNIGVIYWEQKNYDQALSCFIDAAKTFDSIAEYNDLAGVYNNIGLIYSDIKDTTQALHYYDKAVELYNLQKNKQGHATVLLNKSVLLEKPEFYDEAEILLLQTLNIFKTIGYSSGVYNAKINLSRLYSLKKDHKNAIKYGLEALNSPDDKSLKHLSEGYFILSENYFDLKNYKSAYQYLKKYTVINDSIFNLEKNKQINELRTKYETDKKEAQITILKKDAEIKALELEKKQKRIKLISIILLIIIIFTVLSTILYLQKRASYLKLVKQNVALAKSENKKYNRIDTDRVKQKIQKYKDTNLSSEQKQELIENIISLMENEKYYRSEQFTIRDFALQLNSNRSYLSQIINEYFQTSFTNFVNEYRVKEARQLLMDKNYNQYTLEAIGNMAGFHSKGTFISSFKKFTGVTPSFFRKNAQL
jgi:tetratricopeptide (TPR) repeat protein